MIPPNGNSFVHSTNMCFLTTFIRHMVDFGGRGGDRDKQDTVPALTKAAL